MKNQNRILVVGLDGFEQTYANKLMAAGELPSLARLKKRSATWLLEHGTATNTGLAWEHFSTGLSPRDAGRYSAVHFDTANYTVCQKGTVLPPFVRGFSGKTVVFDPPYFDLSQAPNVEGIVNWGAHDPGVNTKSYPIELFGEVEKKFGSYPGKDWIYGVTWQSIKKTAKMREALLASIEKRKQIAEWLLTDRIKDWELGIIVIGELHSAAEAFWHGIDEQHPLHCHPSAEISADAMLEIYRSTDNFIERMENRFPNTTLIAFSMGGMGINNSDIPCMALLPEFMYRKEFGAPYMQDKISDTTTSEVPWINESDSWPEYIKSIYPEKKKLLNSLGFLVKKSFRLLFNKTHINSGRFVSALDWMPAFKYIGFWPEMKAFALPSFYDGRIRVNLIGREKHGNVKLIDYDSYLTELETFLLDCTDLSGQSIVESIEKHSCSEAMHLDETDVDLKIIWKNSPLTLKHPVIGQIGPLPYRRPGGHTGPYGIIYIRGNIVEPGDYGVRSSFDVAPTIVDILGFAKPEKITGKSLVS